ncbi:rubrerythrin family protein [Geoglobus acetivorans]|uniref:rubrerythrin family protein n=1 Tax=Geoglobus acetivorans TaxID=565033 RepID=UPI00296F25AD
MIKVSTEDNLKNAFSGESQASIKYRIFSEVAKEKGLKNLARVFEAFSFSEFVHAKNHLKALKEKEIEDPLKNIDEAIRGETHEIETMYPEFYDTAIRENRKRAATSFRWALEAEKEHAEVYRKLRVLVESGRDKAFDDRIYVCPNCGYIFTGTPPEICPLCSISKEMFREF